MLSLKRWGRNALVGLSLGAILGGVAGCGDDSNNSVYTVPTTNNSQSTSNVTRALWVANGANVVEFVPSQTIVAGVSDPAPNLSLNSAALVAPQGVQFDGSGNLWVIDGGSTGGGAPQPPGLFLFTSSQLAALHTTANPSPTVTLRSSSLAFPQQAVFSGGNLWVTDNAANSIFVFTPSQLTGGGSNVTPFATITSNPPFNGPLGIAFDPTSGNLFIANNADTTIYEFNASSLPASSGNVTLTPNAILSNSNGSIQGPWGLIFDGAGDLYSSNANAPNTVVEFAHSSLNVTGSPTPILTLSPATDGTATTLSAPNGIALDNLGDLAAISSATPFGVPIYAASQLTGSGGALLPAALLVGSNTTLNAPAGCTFGPVVP